MPDRVDPCIHLVIPVGPQPDLPPAEELPLENLAVQPRLESHPRSWFELLARVDEADRICSRGVAGPFSGEQQALDRAAARHAASEQPRREHARIVGDEQVARTKERWQIANPGVSDRTGLPIQHEHPRLAAGRGGLRNQVVGQMEVEVGTFTAGDNGGGRRQRILETKPRRRTEVAFVEPRSARRGGTNALRFPSLLRF